VKKIFCTFFQSTHQVDMKNVDECYKHFFGYFNALETNGVLSSYLIEVLQKRNGDGLDFKTLYSRWNDELK
jgi:hypothetical protein